MDTSYADAIAALEQDVDNACNDQLHVLSHADIAKELRRIAQGWEDAA